MADGTRSGLRARVTETVATGRTSRPVRVVQRYLDRRGSLLAAGMSYQALFAVFAGIWVGFSVAGLFLAGHPALSDALFTFLNTSVPGLIDTGAGGIIDPDQLLEAQTLGWTGIVALVSLLITALAWLAYARTSVRAIFEVPLPTTPYLLLKLKDFGLTVAYGLAVLVSAALSVVSTSALEGMFGLLGLTDSPVAVATTRSVGLTLMFVLDTVVLATLYRVLSGLRIPLPRLVAGSMLAAAGLGLLKVLGTALLGGATRNPLLASFAVVIGLLIWFNLVCHVILIGAAWIAVGMADRGLAPDPRLAAAEEERRRAERERVQTEARELVPRWLRWAVRSPDRRRKRDGGSA
ncbi:MULTISPECIES: YihY/virulence factor BrkB family protein [unclassified Salinibacterium]|uniref:YihY/virulence factor BrkB family protein n=1 Tax=unclassified Salinibacterium TaxID=2632331 RepID=UPI0014236E7D|nr:MULTISPECIES: YihY/virulence factor BrkB family protein [unclassified Salinibacterium]